MQTLSVPVRSFLFHGAFCFAPVQPTEKATAGKALKPFRQWPFLTKTKLMRPAKPQGAV